MTDEQGARWGFVRRALAALRAGWTPSRALAAPRRPEVSRSWQRAALTRLSAARLTALLGSALLLGVLTAWLWRSDPNLSRGAVVSASSTDFDTVAAGAVDGFRYGQLGFHSGAERPAWLALDLGGPRVITRVQAYGRGDCCFDQSLPLALEISDDGTQYRALTTRRQPFTQYEPWIFRPGEELVARFVRLRAKGKQPLVLSEVEVYGHEPR